MGHSAETRTLENMQCSRDQPIVQDRCRRDAYFTALGCVQTKDPISAFIYGMNSGPTWVELKQFSMLWRSLPKMILRVSKGERVRESPKQSQSGQIHVVEMRKRNFVCPGSSDMAESILKNIYCLFQGVSLFALLLTFPRYKEEVKKVKRTRGKKSSRVISRRLLWTKCHFHTLPNPDVMVRILTRSIHEGFRVDAVKS